jgi:hypothetical protein
VSLDLAVELAVGRVHLVEARRPGTRQRLIGTGLLPGRVDNVLKAFDALPERAGLAWDGEAACWWVLAQPRR